MKIKHNFSTGKTIIELSWDETRQFISTGAAREVVADLVANLVASPAPEGDNNIKITTH